jgi:hypothetical protein
MAPDGAVTAERTPLVSLAIPVALALLMSLPVVELNRATSESTEEEGPTTSPVPPPVAERVPADIDRPEPIAISSTAPVEAVVRPNSLAVAMVSPAAV